MVSLSTIIGSSNDALNVSPNRAVSESTESIIRTATIVPDGTVSCRGGGGSTRSGLTSSAGAAGTGIGGATGAGNVNVPGAVDAVFDAGAADGAGAFTVRGVAFGAVCRFGVTGCGRSSTTGAASGCGCGAGAAAGAGAGSCCSADLPCSFGFG